MTIAEAIAAGVEHHRAGRLQEAERIYRAVLAADPASADAWNLLSIVAAQVGQHEQAAAFSERAVALAPGCAEYHYNLGFALHLQGQSEPAISAYRRALELDTAHTGALNNLGTVLGDLGRRTEALACHRRACELSPASPEAHFNLANDLKAEKRWNEAIASYRRALDLRPAWGEALSNLGDAYQGRGEYDQAVAAYQQALLHLPDSPQVLSNLGGALQKLGDGEAAIACYRRALELAPQFAKAHLNLALAWHERGEVEQAQPPAERAVELNPLDAEAQNALGLVLRDQGEWDAAQRCFEQALAIDPENAAAHTNHAMLLLACGEFSTGWTEYEWRWQGGQLQKRAFEQPAWDGGSLEGKTILLYAEQGLGDTLQFVRYARRVKALGASVVLECPPALVRLLASCAGIDRLVAQGDELPPFDAYAPLLSLPRLMQTTLETIPNHVPYLAADPELAAYWRGKLAHLKGLRVGIHWRGRGGQGVFRRRDIPLAHLAELDTEAVSLVSLQKGADSQERSSADTANIYFPDEPIDTTNGGFMDTAAIMSNLDLIITSDTSLPHLAGALGLPVWLALPHVPSWQWLRERRDSPWYPTLRIFRQSAPGDWTGVFKALRRELSNLVNNGR